MTLPSQEILKKVNQKIKNVPNRQGEYKRKIHYCCFLLGYKSGLRISEAVKFDLSAKNRKGLYRIEKPKGKKERYVYVSPSVINELKNNNWQPNQTNRFNFYHFLRKIKRELGINKNIELTPHTLRRSFTTHHANSGMPLPLLKKLLGHSSIRTTALYWHDTDGDGDNDIPDIPQVKKWLEEKRMKELPELPNAENFPLKSPETPISSKNPLIKKDNLPLLTNYQPKLLTNQISPEKQAKFSLNIANEKKEISEQLQLITNNPSQNPEREEILLSKIKYLEDKISEIQNENNSLKQLVQQEKQRADNYQQQLKVIIKSLKQWQKINYYQQLEQEQEAKIIQLPPDKTRK